ncbi:MULTISPECIES: nucleotidyltransferase family protein [Halorussus]|uniref:nucleotidyltransferase family protein n=1 Tax=Halorussus TaxID=1070314 RepID=UPI00209F70AA|nr:nucleotidyltransferase family protein [Halorussus vallis]USZ77787.1 nucleotidyltransferase family protein [Halorussus vallis]
MILGALLAAGTGSRFEGDTDVRVGADNKLLADLDGEPVVTRAARTLLNARLDAVAAVVGHDRERVAAALPSGVEIVANPDYERGQSASVRRAAALARERGADAVLFALGDMPLVSVETVDALAAAYREGRAADGEEPGIVVPRYEGERGNPVLFDARYFDALAAVEGDRGGRRLVESEPVARVDVDDPGVRRDVDTVSDLRALAESASGASDSSDAPEADPHRD